VSGATKPNYSEVPFHLRGSITTENSLLAESNPRKRQPEQAWTLLGVATPATVSETTRQPMLPSTRVLLLGVATLKQMRPSRNNSTGTRNVVRRWGQSGVESSCVFTKVVGIAKKREPLHGRKPTERHEMRHSQHGSCRSPGNRQV
jgi:hypothetical protein